MNRLNTSLLMLTLISLPLAGTVQAGIIQAAIDAADEGSVVRIPPGAYVETVTLKDGITLVGAGAEATVIDGHGSDVVVTGGRNSALIGVTVRNGKKNILNNGYFMGIFDCKITGYTHVGIEIGEGTAVIANNLISDSAKAIGIVVRSANPRIMNNVIVNNQIGILAVGNYLIAANNIGIQLSDHAELFSAGNLFDQNAMHNINGGNLSETDVVQPVDLSLVKGFNESPADPQRILFYRRLMKTSSEELIEEHPVVFYHLLPELGAFRVITMFPWVTFTVSASTKDTVIKDYVAYDSIRRDALFAEYVDK